MATDGTVDWFCCPRFDSPSVFASLLDADHGGYFRVGPDRDDYVTKQLYVPDTAILITRFLTPDGVGEVHDFMPVAGRSVTDGHRLIRQLRVVRGTMRFVTDIQPRFDYARQPHTLELSEDGAVFRAESLELTLHLVGPRDTSLQAQGITMERQGDGVRLTRVLREGQVGAIVLESMGGPAHRLTPEELERLRTETVQFWRTWLDSSTYRGRWRDMVTALGDDAQADDLRADRRDYRGTHHRAARAGRRRTELGLPVRLDPGWLVLRLRAARPGLHRRGRGLYWMAARPGHRGLRRRLGAAEDHVPGRRHLGPG